MALAEAKSPQPRAGADSSPLRCPSVDQLAKDLSEQLHTDLSWGHPRPAFSLIDDLRVSKTTREYTTIFRTLRADGTAICLLPLIYDSAVWLHPHSRQFHTQAYLAYLMGT